MVMLENKCVHGPTAENVMHASVTCVENIIVFRGRPDLSTLFVIPVQPALPNVYFENGDF